VIAVVQRVAEARVLVAGECVGQIERGLLVLLGVEHGDTDADADATAKKVAALRVFPGRTPTDLAVGDVGGGCLVVSQFTLAAELGSGNRPDFTAAAPPEAAAGLCARAVAPPLPACRSRPDDLARRCASNWSTTARSRWC